MPKWVQNMHTLVEQRPEWVKLDKSQQRFRYWKVLCDKYVTLGHNSLNSMGFSSKKKYMDHMFTSFTKLPERIAQFKHLRNTHSMITKSTGPIIDQYLVIVQNLLREFSWSITGLLRKSILNFLYLRLQTIFFIEDLVFNQLKRISQICRLKSSAIHF